MVKNPEILREFEDEWLRSQETTLEEKWQMFDMMAEHARRFCPVSEEDLMNFEVPLRIARVLNADYFANKENSKNS